MLEPIPKYLIRIIEKRVANGMDFSEAIENEAYLWMGNHPTTSWTPIELVFALKESEEMKRIWIFNCRSKDTE